MITNRGGLANLKMFDVANLFERSMILLNLPVLVVKFEKPSVIKNDPCLCKEESLMMVFDHLEMIQATVPAIPRHKGRFQTLCQHFHLHFLKIIVFCLVFGFIVNPVIDRLMMALGISVI